MALSISSLMVNSGPEIYYTEKWFRQLEDHIPQLRSSRQTQIVEVQPHIAHRNRGNIAGLLLDLNIPTDRHYTVARVNLWERNEDIVDIRMVLIPAETEIDRLRKLLPAS